MKSKTGKNLQLRIGIFLLAGIFLLMIGFSLSRGLAIEIDMNRQLEPPSSTYLLGTDDLGRDLISCLVYGVGISLLIGLTVVILSALIGGVLGMVSGFAGGIVDTVIMRVVDIILAFPGLLLAIALASFFNPGMVTLILVLTISGWVGCARIVRGEVLKYKQKEFILAAKSYNASFSRIIFHHMFPLVSPLMVIQASLDIAGVILAESSLNFLGIGLDPEIPTLGQLIDAGQDHLFDRPELIVVPGVVLFIIIIAFNFIGEGLRKKFTK
ncbi:MAG: ABC transporter permease [Candidatus Aminicenantes bacterium]|nr:MAG: ABC transporter permease [Candidatus Aminicenantes bacterium]